MTRTDRTKEDDQLEGLREAAQAASLELPELVLPDGRDVIANRMRLHFLDWGTAGRPTVIFLHGGSLTAHTWDLVCLALRDRYRCLAPDMRGHGESEWSPTMDYSVEAHVADLEGLVEYLGLDRFMLVGMSLGGLTSLAYAGKHAARLDRVVIVDVGPEIRSEGVTEIHRFVEMPAELGTVEDFVDRALSFNPRRDPVLLRRSLLHNLRQLPNGNWTWKYDRRHKVNRDLNALAEQHAKLWDVVPLITTPTLVVRGGVSNIFSDEQAEALANALPNGSWAVVEGAGHTVQGDNPAGLVALLDHFLP